MTKTMVPVWIFLLCAYLFSHATAENKGNWLFFIFLRHTFTKVFTDRKLYNTFLSVLFSNILIPRVHTKKYTHTHSFVLKYVFFTLVLLQSLGIYFGAQCHSSVFSALSIRDCAQQQV